MSKMYRIIKENQYLVSKILLTMHICLATPLKYNVLLWSLEMPEGLRMLLNSVTVDCSDLAT